jgi:hypothetical protein
MSQEPVSEEFLAKLLARDAIERKVGEEFLAVIRQNLDQEYAGGLHGYSFSVPLPSYVAGERKNVSPWAWPRDEKLVAKLKELSGIELAVSYNKHSPVTLEQKAVVRWMANFSQSAVRLDRGQWLLRLNKISRTGGMGSQIVTGRLTMMMAPLARRKEPYGYEPDLDNYYMNWEVQWWGDKSVTMSCEGVTKDGIDVGVYFWQGCDHKFGHQSGGNCYHIYTCEHCKHRYDIDSGD